MPGLLLPEEEGGVVVPGLLLPEEEGGVVVPGLLGVWTGVQHLLWIHALLNVKFIIVQKSTLLEIDTKRKRKQKQSSESFIEKLVTNLNSIYF